MADEAGEGSGRDLGVPGLEGAELVGRGGAAVVYRALQTSLQRVVAVKLLTSSWDESVARRFDREQRAMGRLSNRPGIVPVYESGLTSDGAPYIVMPYYPDGSLKDWVEKHGPMPWERAVEVILAVAEAVGKAHAEGIVHRDLKPANVLMTATGKPLLADFGIARLSSDSTGIETTAVTFTPAYCPPEVLDEAEPDASADTYSLAATFWALVQGSPPFTESNTPMPMEAVLKRVLTETAPRLDGVPSSIADFIGRSLSKNPGERPPDGQSFADQLREAVASAIAPDQPDAGDTVVVSRKAEPPPGLRPKTPTPKAKTNRVVVAAGILIAAVVLAGVVGILVRSGSSPAETEPEPVPAEVVVAADERIQLLMLGVDPLEASSVQATRASQLAIDDFGSIAGFDIEVLPTVEVACNPAISESVQSTLRSTNAAALLGSTCPESARSVMNEAFEQSLSWVATGLNAPSLTAQTDGSDETSHIDGFFRIAQNDQFQGTVAAQFATEDLGARTAVVVQGSTPSHAAIANSFASAFASNGQVSTIEVSSDDDLDDVAAELVATGSDVTFWVLDAEAAVDLSDAIDGLAVDGAPVRVAIDDVLTSSSIRRPSMSDLFVVTPLQPDESAISATDRTLGEIENAYVAAFGEAPDDLFDLASIYDATVIALESIEAVATPAEGTLTISREELRSTFESATSNGLTGSLTCDSVGECGSQSMTIVQVDGVSLDSTRQNVVKFFIRAS